MTMNQLFPILIKPFVAVFFALSLGSMIIAQENPKKLLSGVEREHFDLSIPPSEDFFQHVNGKWLKNTPIPADQSNYGSFTILDIQTKDAIRSLIEEASAQANPSPIAKQVGDFFRSFTDVEQRNKLGISPIQPMLDQVRAITSKEQLIEVCGRLSRMGVPSFFGLGVDVDARRSDQYAVYVSQDGITLPDRDYYLVVDDAAKGKVRQSFLLFIEQSLKDVDWSDATRLSEDILDLETKFAKSQWTQVQLRDPVKGYNKMPSSAFASTYTNLLWEKFAPTVGVPVGSELIVGQPSFFQSASDILELTDLETLKAYLAFQIVDTYAPSLSEELEKKHFDFHETVLSGVAEQQPLWRRAVDACNRLLGMPVGQLYVEKYFSPKAKLKMNSLVKNLLSAFERRIDQLEWMGKGTKAQAKEKLSLFTPKIGYPDKWKDYSSVDIVPDNLVANLMKIAEFEHVTQLNKLGKPIDRSEWFMPPQTVNAYYNPTMNEIVFPAAILQPPFFNLEADDAINYGAIGAVIGHEISHGFDDSGAQYDGKGNLRDWWTENDKAEFKTRSSMLVSVYDAFSPLPNSKVNGSLTLGENIGDLGGISVAYTAYKLSLADAKAPEIDGYSGDQRFFIGWAQVWRRKYRDQEMLKRLMTDPHSPSQYRCNGIMSHFDTFYEAFAVKDGAKMYVDPSKRVRIW
jgi:putative endopeptidase